MTDLVHSGSASIPGGDEATGATMLERAVRAIGEVVIFTGRDGSVATLRGGLSETILTDVARAVLMAVRTDFSRSVSDAGKHTVKGAADECERNQAGSAFTAMIDAILADGEGR